MLSSFSGGWYVPSKKPRTQHGIDGHLVYAIPLLGLRLVQLALALLVGVPLLILAILSFIPIMRRAFLWTARNVYVRIMPRK
jgi:hypothetical protein